MPSAPVAERRLVSVLFADLIGFTASRALIESFEGHALVDSHLGPGGAVHLVQFERKRLDAMGRGKSAQLAAQEAEVERLKSIVAFLGSLTGKPDASYIAKPALPPSGKNTPKPDPS